MKQMIFTITAYIVIERRSSRWVISMKIQQFLEMNGKFARINKEFEVVFRKSVVLASQSNNCDDFPEQLIRLEVCPDHFQ